MRNIKNLLLFLSMAALWCSCSNEESDANLTRETITFVPTVATSGTRSAMEAGFAEGDKIGLYLYDASATTVYKTDVWKSNTSISCGSNGTWTNKEELYWQDVPYSTLSCVAYYPFKSVDNGNNLTSVTVQTDTDQSSVSQLRANDFLWAKVDDMIYSQYSHGIPLKMGHLMSKVTVSFSNFTEAISLCQLRGAALDGVANLMTGSVKTNSGSGQSITMYYDENTKTAEAVILPQTIGEGIFISFQAGEEHYYYTLTESLTLTSGSEYLITLDGSTL